MLKRFGRGEFDGDRFDSEDVNPMGGVSNLADAMLVLAVGLMLALIIAGKVDVKESVTRVEKENMTEITDYDSVDQNEVTEKLGEDGLEKKGSVYVDPDTGKMYIAVPVEE